MHGEDFARLAELGRDRIADDEQQHRHHRDMRVGTGDEATQQQPLALGAVFRGEIGADGFEPQRHDHGNEVHRGKDQHIFAQHHRAEDAGDGRLGQER